MATAGLACNEPGGGVDGYGSFGQREQGVSEGEEMRWTERDDDLRKGGERGETKRGRVLFWWGKLS